MFNFKFNQEEATKIEKENNFTVLPKGEYEAFITKVDVNHVSPNKGTKGINLTFTIRDDVEQMGAKRKVFDTIWYANADGSQNKGIDRLQPLLNKVGVPNGMDVNLSTLPELLFGKPVRIELEINEYNGKESNRVTFMGFKEATVGGRYVAPAEDGPNRSGAAVDISDDDLPF